MTQSTPFQVYLRTLKLALADARLELTVPEYAALCKVVLCQLERESTGDTEAA